MKLFYDVYFIFDNTCNTFDYCRYRVVDYCASVTLLLIDLFTVLSANYVSHMPCTREIHGPMQATIVSLIRALVDTDRATVRED